MSKQKDTSKTGINPANSLELLDLWEPFLKAWAHIDRSIEDQPVPPGGDAASLLQGIPFGVKDIIDVAGMPTGFGWDAVDFLDPVTSDASIVSKLREAGAVPIGKTRSTAFAFVDPTITCNPYDFQRSPGGSSSGSGAVVGAGIVPFSLGTQTAGSLCRPAAYCGAVSYKPTIGIFPTDGVAPLSHSFDTVGVIAESLSWINAIFPVFKKAFPFFEAGVKTEGPLKIGLITVPEQEPSSCMRLAMNDCIEKISRGGHKVEKVTSPVSFSDLIKLHRTIMLAEAAENLDPFVDANKAKLPPLLAAGLDEGAHIERSDRNSAKRMVEGLRVTFWEMLTGYDLLMAYPIPDAAPIGLNTTGDQSYLTPWTALAGPLITLPTHMTPDGMPIGILLASAPGTDGTLIQVANKLADLLPSCARPKVPKLTPATLT